MADYEDNTPSKRTEEEWHAKNREINRLKAQNEDNFNHLQSQLEQHDEEKSKWQKALSENDKLKKTNKKLELDRDRLNKDYEAQKNLVEDAKKKEAAAKRYAESLMQQATQLGTELGRAHQIDEYRVQDQLEASTARDEYAIKAKALEMEARIREGELEELRAELRRHDPALARLHGLHELLSDHLLRPSDSDLDGEDIDKLDLLDISDRLLARLARVHQSPSVSGSNSPTKSIRPLFPLQTESLQDVLEGCGYNSASDAQSQSKSSQYSASLGSETGDADQTNHLEASDLYGKETDDGDVDDTLVPEQTQSTPVHGIFNTTVASIPPTPRAASTLSKIQSTETPPLSPLHKLPPRYAFAKMLHTDIKPRTPGPTQAQRPPIQTQREQPPVLRGLYDLLAGKFSLYLALTFLAVFAYYIVLTVFWYTELQAWRTANRPHAAEVWRRIGDGAGLYYTHAYVGRYPSSNIRFYLVQTLRCVLESMLRFGGIEVDHSGHRLLG